MRQILLAIFLLLYSAGSIYAQINIDKSKGRFYFQEGESRDIGAVMAGTVAYDTFWFENIGNSPITMKAVSSSSAFIVPDWSREMVKPQQLGYIAYMVKPGKQMGPCNAEFSIFSDGINTTGGKLCKLHIKGEVTKNNAKPAKKKKSAKKATAVSAK